ncbi:MAG: pyridoxamine 5'-phosphate oxidase, partial [Chloroflexota bacterium]
LESGDDVVILEGAVEVISDPERLAHVGRVYATKYNMDEWEVGDNPLYAVRPQQAFGWLERDFPGSATRWQF